MRNKIFGIAILLLIFSLAAAAANQYGIAEKRQVTFYTDVRVGDTLLPAGDYLVTHQMQGDQHIMIFSQAGKRNGTEARVKCTLVPLATPAPRTETQYSFNSARERVLTRMVFRGDRAEHQF